MEDCSAYKVFFFQSLAYAPYSIIYPFLAAHQLYVFTQYFPEDLSVNTYLK